MNVGDDMFTLPLTTGHCLPTVYGVYRPVEQYLELLRELEPACAEAALTVQPLDGLLISLLLGFHPRRPVVVDLAAAASGGASTVLCATQPRVQTVMEDWSSP